MAQLLADFWVVAEIKFSADEDDGDAWCVVLDFGEPLQKSHMSVVDAVRWIADLMDYLGFNVVKRRRADDGEAYEEDVGLRVRQRTKSIVVFLSSRVPESEAYGLAIDHDTGGVIVEPIVESVSMIDGVWW